MRATRGARFEQEQGELGQVTNVLGPGVALNMDTFLQELVGLRSGGVPDPKIWISDRAQIVMPYHILLDQYEEAKNVLFTHLYRRPTPSIAEVVEALVETGERLRPYICDTTSLLHEAPAQGKQVLLEGQPGALRDPDHGIYPYPTSSSPLAGFAAVGAGVPPGEIREIVAVAKAYSSCVGAGPIVTELFNAKGDELRRRGGDMGEYGATTGRPRRVGWFDAVATRYGCRIQGATSIALSLLDVPAYLDEIPVCIAYEINGTRTDDFPATYLLEQARPVYKRLPGWRSDISAIRDYADLPVACKTYVAYIEELIGVPINWLGVGPRRRDVIAR